MELLIINRDQFGYHTDTLEYCRALVPTHRITYLCIDRGRPRIDLPGIQVIYVSRHHLRIVRYVAFLASSVRHSRNSSDAVFIKRFTGCFLLPILAGRAGMLLDIRTQSVTENPVSRAIENLGIRWDACWFNRVTIVSTHVAKVLGVESKCSVVPLGGRQLLPTTKRPYRPQQLRAIYVGTLTSRGIDRLVDSFADFERSSDSGSTLQIIGSGSAKDVRRVDSAISRSGLEKQIKLLGDLRGDALSREFANANLGLVFVPDQTRYRGQPSTKLYEYLVNGLPVLTTPVAGATDAANTVQGAVFQSPENAFATAFDIIAARLPDFDNVSIAKQAEVFDWQVIVRDFLLPALDELPSRWKHGRKTESSP